MRDGRSGACRDARPHGPGVVLYASSHLPTRFGTFLCHVFRDRTGAEHVALVAGEPADTPPAPLCRVHSECVTSEVFGSLKCDCRLQLDLALDRIAREGAGLVVYLRQEGRGIGLGDKIRAYALQDRGHDTVDANRLLGLPDDARDYAVAAEILAHLGVRAVRLMTNNPAKVEGLERHGIEVVERVAHHVDPPAAAAARYLAVKRERMGHLLAAEEGEEPSDAAAPLRRVAPEAAADLGDR